MSLNLSGYNQFTTPTPGRLWRAHPLTEFERNSRVFTVFHGGTVVVLLASIFNRNVANNAGWAVDGADLQVSRDLQIEPRLNIDAKLAVRDSDGFLHRLSYQVTALGVDDRPAVINDKPTGAVVGGAADDAL